jgi:DNA-binding transcriptional LysR family regulator
MSFRCNLHDELRQFVCTSAAMIVQCVSTRLMAALLPEFYWWFFSISFLERPDHRQPVIIELGTIDLFAR